MENNVKVTETEDTVIYTIDTDADVPENESLDIDYDAQITEYIYIYYSPTKQASDQADKEYFSTILKAKGVENLEVIVAAKVQDFFKGATLESLVADIADEDKEACIQLTKVGIRVTWVQMCKQELRKAITENREPEFPKYPL